MQITRKTAYALRAAYELARLGPEARAKAAAIARTQAIPVRFLETILHELAQAGFVVSRRGRHGGYQLAREPGALSVGDLMAFTQGPSSGFVPTLDVSPPGPPPLSDFVFEKLWQQIGDTVASALGAITLQDLLDWEGEHARSRQPIAYVI